MISLATIDAYQALTPIIERWKAQGMSIHDEKQLRQDLALLVAMHACRPGSFAVAYAWMALLESLGVETRSHGVSFWRYPRHWLAWKRRQIVELGRRLRRLERFVKIQSDGSWCIVEAHQVFDMAQGLDDYTKQDVYMTRKQFEALPEFQGW